MFPQINIQSFMFEYYCYQQFKLYLTSSDVMVVSE
jgi:hypothetical protein